MSKIDINQTTLMGFVGSDPVVSSNNKQPFACINLATNKSYKKDDEWVTKTHWHKLVCFGQLATLAKQHVKKGSRLFVMGELTYSPWTDTKGSVHQTAQVVVNQLRFLDKTIIEDAQASSTSETPEVDSNDIPF